jgi:hypothetical protein
LVDRVVHGVEQRQIAQLGTTVNVALRKDVAAHHHVVDWRRDFDPSNSWTSCTSGKLQNGELV